MPRRCLSIYMKLINSSCSPWALGVETVQRYMRTLTRSLGTGSLYSTTTPVQACTYLLLHLWNGRRDIITRVYQMTFMNGLHMTEEGVKGVTKVKWMKTLDLSQTTYHCIVQNISLSITVTNKEVTSLHYNPPHKLLHQRMTLDVRCSTDLMNYLSRLDPTCLICP